MIIISTSKKDLLTPNQFALTVFGSMMGVGILNLLFAAQFTLYIAGVSSGFVNIIRIYSVGFLTPLKLLIVIMFVCLYTAYTGIKTQ